MSTALVPSTPSRQELEALTLADRVALEDAFGEAHELIRALNNDEIKRLHGAGASQRAIAEACGRSHGWVRSRLAEQGLAADRHAVSGTQAVTQTGDSTEDSVTEAEVVDGELVDDETTPVTDSPKPSKECCPTCGRLLPAHMQPPPVPRRQK